MIIPFMLDKQLVLTKEYGGEKKLKMSQIAPLRAIPVISCSLICVFVGWLS